MLKDPPVLCFELCFYFTAPRIPVALDDRGPQGPLGAPKSPQFALRTRHQLPLGTPTSPQEPLGALEGASLRRHVFRSNRLLSGRIGLFN